MITVQNVDKFIGKRELFENVSFHVSPGERIGVIGRNGAGKTTLFHILLGDVEPDSGIVSKPKDLSIGYLPQQCVPAEGKTVIGRAVDVNEQFNDLRAEIKAVQSLLDCGQSDEESGAAAVRLSHLLEKVEHLGGYDIEARAAKILAGLGFREEWMNLETTSLSGGWIMRLELARLLLSEPELLLLDEPTNHLDLSSLLWLEQYLQGTSSAMLIVSHDRVFLNKLVRRVFEIEQGKLNEYVGNYDDYVREKAVREEVRYAAYRNQQDRIRQMERFIERNRYRKSTASRAQSRIKLLDKIEKVEAPGEERPGIRFSFPSPSRSGKIAVELRGVRKSYGDFTVYEGIDLVVERGDRIAFIGENGAGKSTLLKMLAGVESVTAGELIPGHGSVTGYYAQHQWEQLQTDRTVLEEATSVSGDLPQSRLRGLLGAFLFQGEDVLKKIGVLSGGEKARLTLCKLLLGRPNLLLLDEPTNHLDIPSREVLEQALRDFGGTFCFISHDRHFINAIANKVLFVKEGKIHIFPGNHDDFLNIWIKRLEDESASVPAEAGREERKRTETGAPVQNGQSRKRVEAEWRNELYRMKKPLRERIEEIEAELREAHERLEELNAALADPETYRDGRTAIEIRRDHQQCRARIGELTEEWEERSFEMEEIEETFRRERESAG